MYEVTTDTIQNRLTLTFSGEQTVEEADAAADDVLDAADSLTAGFTMVNDIREFEPMSQDAVSAIERAKAGLNDRDIAAVARVTGESVVGSMQFRRVGDQDYEVYEVESVEDAHDVLADH